MTSDAYARFFAWRDLATHESELTAVEFGSWPAVFDAAADLFRRHAPQNTWVAVAPHVASSIDEGRKS